MDNQKVMTLDEFQKFFSDLFDAKIREAGMDSVDRKHAMFPTEGDPNGDSLKDLTREQRVAKFLSSVVMGDKAVAKALSEGTAADGGYLVPTEFRASVISKLVKEAVIRPRATVIPMGTDSIDVPADANAVTVSWKAENAALTEANPTFGNVALTAHKLTGLSKMSRELFADSAINIVDYISTKFAQAFAKEEDAKFMTGSGSAQPKGIRQETFSNAVAQAGASLVANDLIELFYSLDSQYRRNAVWLLHNSRIKLIRKLVDSNGQYLWTPGLGDAPSTILGRPVLEQNDIPTNLGAGTNESEVYFGDLSYYIIGDRQQLTVESTTEGAGAFENHQVALKVIERVDGELGMVEAFNKLTGVK